MLDIFKSNYIKLLGIILASIIIDNLFIFATNNPPAWDQGYHLSNVFKMYNILDDVNLNLLNKSNQIIDITESYRGPLTYFLSALFLKIFNNSYHFVYLSNQIFNIICIFSIYELAKLFKNPSIGIWACLIFSFSSLIVNQRSDYLIDLSLTSFSSLCLLFFSKWFLDNKLNNYYSILSGLSLGLIFLVKPTGIIFFFLPFLTIIFKIFRNKNTIFTKINQIFLFILSFALIIFPWFSRHWLTIITSTINAWKWGVNYQEGFKIYSPESWLFYFKSLPNILGIFSSIVFFIIFILEILSQKNLFKINFRNIRKINLWFLIFITSSYLIISLMSTKDIRFIMPIYPLLCIYLSLFLNTINYKYFNSNNKKIILIITIFLSLIASNNWLIFKNLNKSVSYKWPHYEIIKEIKNKSVNLTTTLAVLPDTKEINTFNLEAESARQGEYVAVRQIISNKNTYKEDLKYFDWFLVKTGNQGIMSNESKDLLHQYLLDNSSFVVDNEWVLKDKSKLLLLRRKKLNTLLTQKSCAFSSPYLEIKQNDSGINISFLEKGKSLKSSSLLIDLVGKDFQNFTNVSLANGFFHRSFDKERCYFISQDIPIDFPKTNSNNLSLKVRLLTANGEIKILKNTSENLTLEDKYSGTGYIKMANRIAKVENLGSFLREGQFKNLFDLVGILNQSDPNQIYLKDAERIYFQRYIDNQNQKDLYNILISQILQRKIKEAKETSDLILKYDYKNGNTHLTRSIISLYLFDKKNARLSLENAKRYLKSQESDDILKTVEGLTYLLELKINNALKTFT